VLRIHRLERSGDSGGDKVLLRALDLDLADGQCAWISGVSGSGKTVFLRAIADLDPNDGDLTLDGRERDHFAAPDWRRQVTYVSAEPVWWADSAGAHFSDHVRAAELMVEIGLAADMLSAEIARLSTGERQRLALVRALIQGPRVILLDEPTSALDEKAVDAVESLLKKYQADGLSVILVTHDPEQGRRLADGCFEMRNGILERVGATIPEAEPAGAGRDAP